MDMSGSNIRDRSVGLTEMRYLRDISLDKNIRRSIERRHKMTVFYEGLIKRRT